MEKKLEVMEAETAPAVPRDQAAEKIARLKALGLTTAARELESADLENKALKVCERKLRLAYEHFRYIEPVKIDEFNAILKEKTWKKTPHGGATYDKLVFVPLERYGKVPPDHVLESLERAKGLDCFDAIEVGVLESVEVRPDPMLIGRVKGCDVRFFIDQWDNDVKIEDILKENEG